MGQSAPRNETPKLGDLYMLDWSPGRGSEQTGTRPALVVQSDALNANERYPNTIIVAISTHGRPVPTHVAIPRNKQNGLWESVSYAKCEQVLTVSKARLQRRLGSITAEQRAAVASAIKRVLSLA